jgi:hypothetical protein
MKDVDMFISGLPERCVAYQRPCGEMGTLFEAEYRRFRNELPADEADQINAIWFAVEFTIDDWADVTDVVARFSADTDGNGRVSLGLGTYLLEVARRAIVRWDGPAFAGVRVTPDAIDQLDGSEPLVAGVFSGLAAAFGLEYSPIVRAIRIAEERRRAAQ